MNPENVGYFSAKCSVILLLLQLRILNDGSLHQQFATTTENSLKEHEVLAIFVPLGPCYPKAPCLSFFKFFTTSFKHLCFSKLQNQTSKNRLMKATRLILTIWWGWLCMSTSILWPAWSAPLRIQAQPSVSSTGKSSKVQIPTWPYWEPTSTRYLFFVRPWVHESLYLKPSGSSNFPSKHRE